MRLAVTTILKFIAVCVLAFLLAFAALWAFTDSVQHTFGIQKAAAGCICPPPARTVEIWPNQVAGIDNATNVYGADGAGYLFCLANDDYSAIFGDCYALFAAAGQYNTYNIINWWSHFGYGVSFNWGFTLNNYEGYTEF